MSQTTFRKLWLRLGPAPRLAAGLVTLMISILILSHLLVADFLPDRADEAKRHRTVVGRLAASELIVPLQKGDLSGVREALARLREQTPGLRSAAVHGPEMAPLIAGDHARHWHLADHAPSTIDQVRVALLDRGERWGELQLAFEPVMPESFIDVLKHPLLRGMLVMAVLAFVCFQLYLRRAMRYLDPAAAVPDRVRSAFDTLNEGVLVIDRIGNMMLVNTALARIRTDAGPALIGQPIDTLAWLAAPFHERQRTPPWRNVLAGRGASLGRKIRIDGGDGVTRTVVLNCSPIDNGQDRIQGCLLTLSDITELEERTRKLRKALDDLSASQAEIVAKNAELTWLATRDALTGMLNRRTLMAEAEQAFTRSRITGAPLVCLMCDIDHFKSINDRFGHGAGDRVIESAARELAQAVGERGFVGRYGGEEFCVLLVGQTLEQGLHLAEYARAAIEANTGSAIGLDDAPTVTMSFGATRLVPSIGSTAELIDRADQALYEAKRSGRNRVVPWQEAVATALEEG